jgi:two-component system sensor histidine kinase QseC
MRLRWPWMGRLPRLQRSLSGRVVGTLLITFVLVWLVLLWRDWQSYHRDTSRLGPLQDAAQTLVAALPDDAPGAVLVTRASEQQYNALRQRAQAQNGGEPLGDIILVLSRVADGRELYASAGWRGQAVQAQTEPAMEVAVGPTVHWSVQAQDARWRMRFLEPVVHAPTALRMFATNLVAPMLVALPLVLLPLWWAVRRGLRPLRTLVARVAARRADDFTPLQLDLRYAELHPLLSAFNTLLAQSAQAVARERAFVQDAAHELRTPLAVIGAQAHALSQSAPGSEAHRLALAQLERAIARASHQVHQLLTLARLDGASQRAPEPLDVVAELRDALIAVAPRAQARQMVLSLDAPDTLPAVLDRVALHSVIDNLLSNAVTHGRDGGRVQVSLRADAGPPPCNAKHGPRLKQPPHPLLHLSVADDGPGLAEADRQRLFERFQRAAGSTAAGCGLGLAIVRQAARQMGGEVVHAPGLGGQGACFEVRLVWRLTPAPG